MNYFDFFGLEPKFQIDLKTLKLLYYEKMKQFHPDMSIDASPSEQEETLRLSALNNDAYKVLKDYHSRLKYILDTFYPGGETPSKSLPQMFLMDMMDMNEELMELKMDYEPEIAATLKQQLSTQLEKMEQEITSQVIDKKVSDINLSIFDSINEYLLKRNYLNRAIQNIENEAD